MINVFIGYLGRGFIDNAAHMGGLFSGAILALAVNYRRPGERSGVAVLWQVLQVVCLALVLVSFLMAYRHAPTLRNQLELVQSQPQDVDKFVSYVKAMNEAQETLYYALHDHDTSRVDNSLKELEAAPQLDDKSNELRDGLRLMMMEAKSLPANDKASGETKATQEKVSALAVRFRLWSKEYSDWLKTAGRNYSGLIEITEASPQ
jgi:hypothetical protein